ncbi:diiron oxygenase [Clavibacter sp. CFBP 8614]|uniref:diiron oxygenase n=1 Tax=unclassified Clavibacter TaxID=2626594 RepID=UPI00404120E5
MCGTVGLFVGCAAAAFCPVARTQGTTDAAGVPPDAPPPDYRSAFSSWDARASVRSAPRRVLRPDAGLALFPEELVPVAAHPLVRALGPEVLVGMQTRQLYRYLHFTAKLEHLVVNHVALGIANGDVRVPIPEQMRFDALKIYCDEAYHAYFSVDLIRQAEQLTGIAPPKADEEPFFLVRLRGLQALHEPRLAGLIELAFTIVSETLISSTLTDVGRGVRVDPAVTDAVHDHALDEGRHHAYFAAYLEHLWGSLDPGQREFVAQLFPRLIDVFLDPDRPSVAAELAAYGLPPDQIEQVLADVFSDDIRHAYNRATAAKLLAYLGALDVFSSSAAHEQAASLGLVD